MEVLRHSFVWLQVLWTKQSVREDVELFELGEQRENVDGQILSFLIPNLEPDTSYRVQVFVLRPIYWP